MQAHAIPWEYFTLAIEKAAQALPWQSRTSQLFLRAAAIGKSRHVLHKEAAALLMPLHPVVPSIMCVVK